jgi:hypothetical protein
MAMLLIAHAGHWTSVLFFIPVVVFMGWLAITQYRERRAGRNTGPDEGRPLP